MYLQHFGLKYDPLGKMIRETVVSSQYTELKTRLDGLIETKGIGLITGEAGVGKTTALRQWCNSLNPLTHTVIYQSDNHFRAFDIYSQLADSLGLEKYHRYCKLWRLLKQELLTLQDSKQMTPIWILDEAHQLPMNFLAELPSFLNFSFDTRELLIIILVGLPKLHGILQRTAYATLTSRLCFHFDWKALENFELFSSFIMRAFEHAGKHDVIISQSGLKLIHMSSKGRLRYAHRLITRCLQLGAEAKLNHIADEIIQSAIGELKRLAIN
jgi:type II secretory pathway predicted ATPase ExeA